MLFLPRRVRKQVARGSPFSDPAFACPSCPRRAFAKEDEICSEMFSGLAAPRLRRDHTHKKNSMTRLRIQQVQSCHPTQRHPPKKRPCFEKNSEPICAKHALAVANGVRSRCQGVLRSTALPGSHGTGCVTQKLQNSKMNQPMNGASSGSRSFGFPGGLSGPNPHQKAMVFSNTPSLLKEMRMQFDGNSCTVASALKEAVST